MDTTEPIKQTRFTVTRLPKTQRFACSKRDIKAVFGHNQLDSVSTGVSRLKLAGPVVAVIDGANQWSDRPSMRLCPVRIDQYPESAADEFKSVILPKMKDWLDQELAKPATRIFGHFECLVVEWNGSQHKCHQLRWH